TVVLTLTSLFALLSLQILKRMKEVAVRRVLGASGSSIAYLLNRNFVLILTLGALAGSTTGAILTNVLLDGIFKLNRGVSAAALIHSTLVLLCQPPPAAEIMLGRTIKPNPAEVLKIDS